MSALGAIAKTGAPALGALLGMTQSGDADASLAGVLARGANTAMLKRAKQMRAEGASPEQIWTETKWNRGEKLPGAKEDTAWRFEIDDSKAGFNDSLPFLKNINEGDVGYSLPTVIDHPELFDNYPHLEDIRIGKMQDPDPTDLGEYFNNDRFMRLNLDHRTDDQAFSTSMHEIGHNIQRVEGKPGGSNPDHFRSDQYDDILLDVNKLDDEYDKLQPLYVKAHYKFMDDPSDANQKAVDYFVDLKADITKQRKILTDASEHVTPYRQYRNTYGEGEARNIQERLRIAKEHGPEIMKTSVLHPGKTQPKHMYVNPADSPDHKNNPIKRRSVENTLAAIAALNAIPASASARPGQPYKGFAWMADSITEAQDYAYGPRGTLLQKLMVPGDALENLLQKWSRGEKTSWIEKIETAAGM